MNQHNRPIFIPGYMQPTDMFHGEAVHSYCTEREQYIRQRIQGMSHNETLSSDKQTLFAQLIDSYLSYEIPILNRDEANLKPVSDATHLEFLYIIPYKGDHTYFSYTPSGRFPSHSDEVTIHLDDFHKEITFYYKFERGDDIEQLQSKLQSLLASDIKWVVDSLDDIIRNFREHETRLKEIMYRALEQRIEVVSGIEEMAENIEIPDDIFRNKFSVLGSETRNNQRNPRYNVFRPLLFGRQEGQCAGTGYEIYYSQSSVDHVQPRSAGGANTLDNLKVLCQPCNRLKAAGSWDEYKKKISASPNICMGYKNQHQIE